MDRWTHKWTDGHMDGHIDGQIDTILKNSLLIIKIFYGTS